MSIYMEVLHVDLSGYCTGGPSMSGSSYVGIDADFGLTFPV